ncbi:MAG: type II toxin-antitoxin system HicA family toxin [Patescibacteria group bacterium]
MVHISPLSYKDVIKKLRRLGFVFRRATGGSHEIWWNEQTRKTCVVPHHKEVKTGTIRSIIRQAGINDEEFLKA